MKHAYLIIAHNEFEVLRLLVSALDDQRNDIYVHIDKKVKSMPELHTSNSRLYVLDKRVDVRWGHVSQIESELVLFETACLNGPYERYILLSGVHLPIKTNTYIHEFFDAFDGKELLHFWPFDDYEADTKIRIRNYLLRYYKSGNKVLRTISQYYWNLNQKVHRVLRLLCMKDKLFYKSDNWVCLTEKSVAFLVENKKRILKKYKRSFCGDEFFVATELKHANDRFCLVDCDKLLFVDFIIGAPRNLNANDEKALIESPCLFARKFDSSDRAFLDRVLNHAKDENKDSCMLS